MKKHKLKSLTLGLFNFTSSEEEIDSLRIFSEGLLIQFGHGQLEKLHLNFYNVISSSNSLLVLINCFSGLENCLQLKEFQLELPYWTEIYEQLTFQAKLAEFLLNFSYKHNKLETFHINLGYLSHNVGLFEIHPQLHFSINSIIRNNWRLKKILVNLSGFTALQK